MLFSSGACLNKLLVASWGPGATVMLGRAGTAELKPLPTEKQMWVLRA